MPFVDVDAMPQHLPDGRAFDTSPLSKLGPRLNPTRVAPPICRLPPPVSLYGSFCSSIHQMALIKAGDDERGKSSLALFQQRRSCSGVLRHPVLPIITTENRLIDARLSGNE